MSVLPSLNLDVVSDYNTNGDDDDSDEDLDVIKMTPRNHERAFLGSISPRALNKRFSLQSPVSSTTDEGHVSPGGAPPKREYQGQTDVNRRRNNTFARDPSAHQNSEDQHDTQQNVVVTFISNISRVFSAQETMSDGLSSTHDEEREKDLNSSKNRPLSGLERQAREIGLRDGELPHTRNQLLFDHEHETEKNDFTMFLKDDGSVQRIPVLCMSDFGIGQFAFDLWALPHNAIKRELFDLYDIVSVFRTRYVHLNWGDFYDLRRWWRLFGFFWRQYCEVERKLLDPLIATVLEIDGRRDALQQKVRALREDREWICCKFEEIDGYIEEFELLPRGRVLSLLCKSTDMLGYKVLALFNQQEAFYPPLIESYHSEDIKYTVEEGILNILRDTPFYQESIVHLIRWMERGKERDKWLMSRLRWGERSSLARYFKQYDVSRGKVVSSMRKKLKKL